MNRSKKYLEYCRLIADSLLFLKNAKEEQKHLLKYLEEFKILIQSNESVFKKFPALVRELQDTLNIREFNTETAEKKTEDLKNSMVKLLLGIGIEIGGIPLPPELLDLDWSIYAPC